MGVRVRVEIVKANFILINKKEQDYLRDTFMLVGTPNAELHDYWLIMFEELKKTGEYLCRYVLIRWRASSGASIAL